MYFKYNLEKKKKKKKPYQWVSVWYELEMTCEIEDQESLRLRPIFCVSTKLGEKIVNIFCCYSLRAASKTELNFLEE